MPDQLNILLYGPDRRHKKGTLNPYPFLHCT